MFLFRVTFVHRYRRPNDTILNKHHVCPDFNASKPPYFRCKFSPLCVYLGVVLEFLFLLEVYRVLTNVLCLFLCIYSINYVYLWQLVLIFNSNSGHTPTLTANSALLLIPRNMLFAFYLYNNQQNVTLLISSLAADLSTKIKFWWILSCWCLYLIYTL